MDSTSICNLALSYLAKGTISNINENKELARQCKTHYDHQRRMLLTDYDWGFAKRYAKLAAITMATPYQGYEFAYTYPTGCLAVRRLYQDSSEENEEFIIADIDANTRAILTNIESAYIDYTYDVSDTTIFSEVFCEALARAMAQAMAVPLTGNSTLMQLNYQLMQYAVLKAKVTTAREKKKETVYPTGYFDGRS